MAPPLRIQHCRVCGARSEYRVPAEDTRERAVCTGCGHIDYQNPANVVGTIPVWQGRILLCLRAIEPRRGYWTLPAGFMELGETTEEGAIRETLEESGGRVRLQGLYSIMNVVRAGQVHFFYRAELLDDQLAPGHETLENRFFAPDEIPWDRLAFRTVHETLRRFLDDQRQGHFGLHCVDVA